MSTSELEELGEDTEDLAQGFKTKALFSLIAGKPLEFYILQRGDEIGASVNVLKI